MADQESSTVTQRIPYELVRIVAVGGQAQIHLAHRTDGISPKEIIVKSFPCDHRDDNLSSRRTQVLSRHIGRITALRHENVLRHLEGYFVEAASPTDTKSFKLITEYCTGGTLLATVKNEALSTSLTKKWIQQLFAGLTYIHKQKIVHRDITPTNILLQGTDRETAVLKISDLGYFKKLVADVTRPGEVSGGLGTYRYMSPEMVFGQTEQVHIGRRTDVWSMGCVILLMVTGSEPEFVSENGALLDGLGILSHLRENGLPVIPGDLPGPLDNLVRACLVTDQNQRKHSDEIQSGPLQDFLNS